MPNALTGPLAAAIKPVVVQFGTTIYTGPPDPIAAQTLFINALSEAISMAIVTYLNGMVTVIPGQTVLTTGGPTNQAGTTTSPGKLLAP